jgi:HipA-like protein
MQLLVLLHNQRCGLLSIDESQRMDFRYFPEYIASARPAISVSIPLQAETFPDQIIFHSRNRLHSMQQNWGKSLNRLKPIRF